jgi:hypothetical protein
MKKLPEKLIRAAAAKRYCDREFEKAAKSFIKAQEKEKSAAVKVPITKSQFIKTNIPGNVLTELTQAVETINSYCEDFPLTTGGF